MTGIQFVTDEKGRKGLVSESRRKGKGIPYEQYRAKRLKGHGPRG